MRRRLHDLHRRELLHWLGRTSAGLAGLSLFGCSDTPDGSLDPNTDGGSGTCMPTTSDVLGPYYRTGAPMTIASRTEPGDRLLLEGVLLGPDCAPLDGAALDIWQADRDGTYYDGTRQLDTIVPGNYTLGANSWRPAHIHFTVTHPRFRTLTTQIYLRAIRSCRLTTGAPPVVRMTLRESSRCSPPPAANAVSCGSCSRVHERS